MIVSCRQRGVAAVEFALLLALLLIPLGYGATEFGRAFYQYNTLLKATRSAAREFTLAGRVGTIGSREALALCLAVYGRTPCDSADTPLVWGLSPPLVTISTVDVSGSLPYTYGCVTISGFLFVSLASWVVPDIAFAAIRTCMRQVP